MILSFHPCYVADTNRLCAGRDPDEEDLSAIRAADAVVLPQGCRGPLYQMARKNCPAFQGRSDLSARVMDMPASTPLNTSTMIASPNPL